jgi:DNA-binding response OmpR family regulator
MTESRKRILVADDDPDFAGLLAMELGNRGYEVLVAASGGEALRIARKENPDLILLDVMMPEVDGYHVAQELTRVQEPSSPKILIITCRDVNREKGITVMCGALGAIQKPVDMPSLFARIDELLGSSPEPS